MFYLLYLQVKSSRLDQSFWERHGELIISLIIAALIVGFIAVGSIVVLRKEQAKQQMVELNGKKVDSRKIVTVCLMGSTFQFVQLVKGDVYIAPLCEKDGYDFAGWYYDSAFTKPYYNRPIKSDITLYPKWVKHS